MYKIITVILGILLISANTKAQIGFSPKIDSIIQLATVQTMSQLNRQLTGDTATTIGGNPYTIVSRHWNHPANSMAAKWIKEKFQSYGLTTRYQNNSATNINVIATKIGVKYPNKQYIICGHYDDMPSDSIAPGADDNGSGTCAVIEAARLLANLPMDYTIIFIAFDEEERGKYGSKGYADTAYFRGDSIIGVINLDMIAWDSNNDWKLDVHTNTPSILLADDVVSSFITYVPVMVPTKSISISGGSDHQSFWARNYKAILGIESKSDFNAYYHTVNDKFQNLNVPYFVNMTRGSIAALLGLALDYKASFDHYPLKNINDTNSRIASFVIRSPKILSQPVLYYRINTGNYNMINPYYNNVDTFKFLIPGANYNDSVFYYAAVKDTASSFVCTHPSGGKGFDPPGIIFPPYTIKYKILNYINFSLCSTTLPKSIQDQQIITDTINVTQNQIIYDVDINLTIYHSYDSDLNIYLKDISTFNLTLSNDNGGSGDNYINTTFDDEADSLIINGTPPFNSSYRPEMNISRVYGTSMSRKWILLIYDEKIGDQGTLVSWCMLFKYMNPIGINSNQEPVEFILKQNYPNPFNPSTEIGIRIQYRSKIRLSVYDALGQEVDNIIDKEMNEGYYNIAYKPNKLASGVYYYSMFIDGNLFATKKMVIVK